VAFIVQYSGGCLSREIRCSVILAEYGTADIPREPTRASVVTF